MAVAAGEMVWDVWWGRSWDEMVRVSVGRWGSWEGTVKLDLKRSNPPHQRCVDWPLEPCAIRRCGGSGLRIVPLGTLGPCGLVPPSLALCVLGSVKHHASMSRADGYGLLACERKLFPMREHAQRGGAGGRLGWKDGCA